LVSIFGKLGLPKPAALSDQWLPAGFARQASGWRLSWQGLAFSLLSGGLSTLLLFYFNIAPYNVNMVYVLLTLAATVWFGLGAGVLTATLAFIAFDYFFVAPLFSLLGEIQDGFAVFLFLATAIFTNQVSGRARLHSQLSQARAGEVAALYGLATTVISHVERTQLLQAVLYRLSEALRAEHCSLFLPDETTEAAELAEIVRLGEIAKSPGFDIRLVHKAFASTQPIFSMIGAEIVSQGRRVGRKKTRPPQTILAYLPLSASNRPLGVLALTLENTSTNPSEVDSAKKRLFEIFANHVALAVEHARLIEETTQVGILRESDKLKSALLASVSHELRTPLTAIQTITDSLLNVTIKWTEQSRQEFLKLIEREVSRLSRLVSNLLDLSKIEAGALQLDFGWYYLPEVVEVVVERLKSNGVAKSHTISTAFAAGVPLTRFDYLQLDQVLTNLIENALKYSAEKSRIEVRIDVIKVAPTMVSALPPVRKNAKSATSPHLPGYLAEGELIVSIADEGSGIPPQEMELIFDKFYRLPNPQTGPVIPGTGIGLAIAKGIIESHGGRIWAENRPGGGAVFYFTLPVVELDDLDESGLE
jgi:two-component system sensor histidine kinase KdpD